MNGFNFFNVLESLPGSVVQLERDPGDWKVTDAYPILSPPQILRLYPNKNREKYCNNRKIESARGTMGREKRREPTSLPLFPLPIVPRALIFPSSQSPYDTKRPLRRREYPIGDFLLSTSQPAHLCNNSVVSHYFSFSL